MNKEKKKATLNKVLLKKAKGYTSSEIVEEYQIDEDNSMKLVKRKVTQKDIPSDMNAMKLLIELNNVREVGEFDNFTDEELEKEKDRLLQLLTKKEEKKDE